MAPPEGRTKDGFETQFGTNHLAHFLLIQKLLPTLLETSTPELNSRIIILASVGHRDGEVNFDNIKFDGGYDAWKAYGQSKTANLWTANELERRYGSQDLHAWSLHPGGVFTGLSKHFSEEARQNLAKDEQVDKAAKSVEQGAVTTVWAAAAKALEGPGGRYLEDCQISKPVQSGASQYAPGYAPHAYDEKKEAR